jgi:hypothetical protein
MAPIGSEPMSPDKQFGIDRTGVTQFPAQPLNPVDAHPSELYERPELDERLRNQVKTIEQDCTSDTQEYLDWCDARLSGE